MMKLFKRKRRRELMREIHELKKELAVCNARIKCYEELLKDREAEEAEKWKEVCHYWCNKAQEK